MSALVRNTLLMTVSGFVVRAAAMAFQGYLAGRIGAAGLGLYQLVLSVEFLAVTIAVSGIRFAVTRLVSEELGLGRPGWVGAALLRAALYALMFGSAAMLLMSLFSEPVGFLWIGDARSVLSLRILAYGLPALSLSSVLGGYFTACGRVWKSSLAQLAEQFAAAGFTVLLLGRVPAGDLELSCAAICAGITASDFLSLALLLALFAGDRRRYGSRAAAPGLTGRLLGVALPLAVSAWARGALGTLEQLLVPTGLRKSGLGADAALAGYGLVQGVALPAAALPAALLTALAENSVPVLTAAQVRREREGIRRSVRRLVGFAAVFGLAVSTVLTLSAGFIAGTLFHSPEAAAYIRAMAPLVPIMYSDTAVDGCLKGLGAQVWSMGINLLDAALGVVLVYTLLPKGGLAAYIFVLYADEIINFTLSALRLRRAVRDA